MRATGLACAVATMLGFGAVSVEAQMLPWEDRGFFEVGVALEGGAENIRSNRSFGQFGETATFEEDYSLGGGALLSIEGGGRVWRNLGAGVAYTRVVDQTSASVTGSVPHPLFFNSPLTAGTTVGNLERTETGVHFMALWNYVVSDRIEIRASAGPSILKVSQQVVRGLNVRQVPGTFDVRVESAGAGVLDDSTAGVNVGAAASYRVTDMIGGTLFFRYVGGSVDLPFTATGGDRDIESDAGGSHVGLAVRVYF